MIPTTVNPSGTYLFHPHGDDDYEIFVLKPSEESSASLVDRFPVIRTNIGFVSSKIEVYSNVEGKVISSTKRGKRFTGKSSVEITVQGLTSSLDRESRWGTANRLFVLYNGTCCRAITEGKNVSIVSMATGRVLAAYRNSTRSSKKDGILTMHALGVDNKSCNLIITVVLLVSRSSLYRTLLTQYRWLSSSAMPGTMKRIIGAIKSRRAAKSQRFQNGICNILYLRIRIN